jgi:hypothetical protein
VAVWGDHGLVVGAATVSWTHRIRQFVGRLLTIRPPDDHDARDLLPVAALALYQGMASGDQRHALQVLAALRRSGAWGNEVEQAALLHDVGKSQARLTLAHRVIAVLLHSLAPRWLERQIVAPAPSWRYPFYVHVHHAEIGAALCARAGCSPVTVALVRAHQDPAFAALPPELHAALAALHQADERC